MEAICSSETSVETQRTIRRHIPEDDTLHLFFCLLYFQELVTICSKCEALNREGCSLKYRALRLRIPFQPFYSYRGPTDFVLVSVKPNGCRTDKFLYFHHINVQKWSLNGQKAIGYSKFITLFGDQYKELLIHRLPPVARLLLLTRSLTWIFHSVATRHSSELVPWDNRTAGNRKRFPWKYLQS
jgi:hypothetical protein